MYYVGVIIFIVGIIALGWSFLEVMHFIKDFLRDKENNHLLDSKYTNRYRPRSSFKFNRRFNTLKKIIFASFIIIASGVFFILLSIKNVSYEVPGFIPIASTPSNGVVFFLAVVILIAILIRPKNNITVNTTLTDRVRTLTKLAELATVIALLVALISFLGDVFINDGKKVKAFIQGGSQIGANYDVLINSSDSILPPEFFLVTEVPSFNTNSAEMSRDKILKSICDARSQLEKNKSNMAIVIGRHDKRKILKYDSENISSNSELAQARSDYVADLLGEDGSCSSRGVDQVISLIGGPRIINLKNINKNLNASLSSDRRVEIYGIRKSGVTKTSIEIVPRNIPKNKN